MNSTKKWGKASVRIGILAGIALLILVVVLNFAQLRADKHPVDPELTTQVVSHTGIVEAYKKWSNGSALFLDLRPNSAYARTHIPGAVSIPAEALESRYLDLPADRMIITYCDCPFEEPSVEAARFLIMHGFPNSTSLRGGIEGWIQSGYPIEP